MRTVINIAIAEDHDLVRQGLVALLKDHKNIHVLFDARDGKELLEQLKTARPDVLLLDIEMPVMGGKEVLDKIKVKYPKLKVIIISAYSEKDYVIEFFKLGICAFLPKNYKVDKIVEAIVSVYEQGGYFDNNVSMMLAREINESGSRQKAGPAQHLLSDRELEVLKLICTDKSSKEASDLLGVTKNTIDFHRKNIMRKTGSKNFPALIAYAIQHKLVNPS